jgi:hypothetical protein
MTLSRMERGASSIGTPSLLIEATTTPVSLSQPVRIASVGKRASTSGKLSWWAPGKGIISRLSWSENSATQ